MTTNPPLDLLLIQTWIDALESGNYPQTRGRLRDNKGHCCLGLLCEVSGIGTWVPNGKGSPPAGRDPGFSYRVHESDPNPPSYRPSYEVLRRTGLDPADVTKLIAFNDDAGMSFPEIAQRLRAYYRREHGLTV